MPSTSPAHCVRLDQSLCDRGYHSSHRRDTADGGGAGRSVRARTYQLQHVTNAKGSSYSSQHQWGIAFDFYLKMDVDGDGSVSDDAYNDRTGMFKKAAELAKALGLAWGGDWRSIVDKPHLYLPDWGSATNILKQRYGTFEAFKKTWPKMDVAPVKADSDAGAADLKDIKSGAHGLSVTASSLIIRTAPAGADSGKRYSKDQQVQRSGSVLSAEHRGSRLRTAGCLASILLAGCARTGAGGIC